MEKTHHMKHPLPGTMPLLKESLRQYKSGWLTYIAVLLIPYLVSLLLLLPLGFGTPDQDVPNLPPLWWAGIGLAVIVTIILQIWSGAALLGAITLENRVKFTPAAKAGFKLFFPLLWINILVGLIVVGGFILLIIPGIILAVATSFSTFAMAKENKRGTRAVAESTYLIKGYWWPVFGRLLLLSLIGMVFYLVASIPQWFTAEGSTTFMASELAVGIINIILAPIGVIFLYRIYRHLHSFKTEISEATAAKRVTAIRSALVVGVIIIAIAFFLLPTLAVIGLGSARSQARDARRLSDIKQIQTALEIHYADQGFYPIITTPVPLGTDAYDVLTDDGFVANQQSDDVVYMSMVPKGFSQDDQYTYRSTPDGSSYTIDFELERKIVDLDKGRHTATPEGIE